MEFGWLLRTMPMTCALLPDQYEDRAPQRERLLLLAVLESAVDELRHPNRAVQHDAWEWLQGNLDDDAVAVPLWWLCEHLGLDPMALAQAVRKRRMDLRKRPHLASSGFTKISIGAAAE
jgi:hypothetical protein